MSKPYDRAQLDARLMTLHALVCALVNEVEATEPTIENAVAMGALTSVRLILTSLLPNTVQLTLTVVDDEPTANDAHPDWVPDEAVIE